jgi:hypothetical protein
VSWLTNSRRGYFTYGNVVVITPLDHDAGAYADATKKMVDELR